MLIEEKLYEENIKTKHYDNGTQKLKCPECQPPHNSKDRPLSLTIKTEGIVWFCHHCEFKGGYTERTDIRTIRTNKLTPKYETPKVETKSYDNFLYNY